jgi:hypothetical protein
VYADSFRRKIFVKRSSYNRDKEITEAMAAIRAIRGIGIRPVRAYDIGSGIGFFTQIFHTLYPDVHVYSIDNNHKMKTKQFDWTDNVDFELFDIYGDGFHRFLSKRSQRGTIMVGIHLCRGLAPRFIELFNYIEGVDHMVLIPCCAKMEYEKWTRGLFKQISCENKSWHKDKNIISPKNNVIFASKERA